MANTIPPGRNKKAALTPKAAELGRSFLSALFMGVRTAQIHDAGNKAFERAVDTVRDAADQLYAATGSFTVQFVEESVFLNGQRLRFDGAAFDTVRALREILGAWEMGGVEMQTPPSRDMVQKMVVMLARGPDAAASSPLSAKDLLGSLGIGALGFQAFVDASQPVGTFKVDSATFAVQCYAKLILSIQEQREAVLDTSGRPPRLRVMRVIQDLVELGSERTDFLLRLALNREGADPEDLHAANVCLLSVVLGLLIGLGRIDLVDLGSGALLHDLGRPPGTLDAPTHPHAAACFLRLFAVSSMTRPAMLRAIIAGEHHRPAAGAHLFSRIVAVANAFDARVSGLGGELMSTVDALREVAADPDLDARIVDLLINALRAFPVGYQVVLEDGRYATVRSHAGGSRWDRPIVSVDDEGVRVDLMLRDPNGRFKNRILSTVTPG